MYAGKLDPKDRTGAIVAVLAVHVALGLAILNATGRIDIAQQAQRTLKVFDFAEVEPPPPPPPPMERESPKPKEKEGASAPKNIESKATPVEAPKPKIEVPAPPKIVVTETPAQGNEATQGAAPVRGPGTGAGGSGVGTGSGGSGTGSGGGGGGIASPPRLIQGNISRRDYPPELRGSRVPRQEIEMEFTIGTDGRVRNCHAIRSSGSAILDESTCRLVEQRYVYRPALDRSGRPVSITGRMRRSWWIER